MRTAVQQIMLGTVTQNETKARETLQRIAAAGYDGLELNRFMIHPSPLLVRILTKAAGMPTGKGGNLDWKVTVTRSSAKQRTLKRIRLSSPVCTGLITAMRQM